jgi:hypothetical protein
MRRSFHSAAEAGSGRGIGNWSSFSFELVAAYKVYQSPPTLTSTTAYMQRSKTASAARSATLLAILGAGAALSSHAAPSLPKLPVTAAKISAAAPVQLQSKIRWVPVRHGAKTLRTLDAGSRLLLARSAAQTAGLATVGLSYQDVYGVIDAETSWVPRDGMGRNGVTSMGLAQFEPATAKGLGLKDANDPVQAVHAAAVYMKMGAEWASRKIAHLKLSPEQRAAKLREGVSVYYNLSVRGRNKWDGINTAQLPVETQRHIRNVRSGAQEALELAGKVATA